MPISPILDLMPSRRRYVLLPLLALLPMLALISGAKCYPPDTHVVVFIQSCRRTAIVIFIVAAIVAYIYRRDRENGISFIVGTWSSWGMRL